MTLPKKWSELPEHLLHLIHDMCFIGEDQPVPQFYLRLAQVNKRFHEFFMSDRIWATLDVHGVQNNISADYLRRKVGMTDEESKFCGKFDFAKWRHPAVTLAVFSDFSLYTQAGVLTETHEPSFVLRRFLHSEIDNPHLLRYAARVNHGLCFATMRLRHDDEFMMSVADAGGNSALYAPWKLRDDKDFALKCVSANSGALQYCSNRLLEDKQLLLAHFSKRDGWFNCCVSKKLRDDRDVAMAAVARDPVNLTWCSDRLRADRQVVMAAVLLDPRVLLGGSEELQRELSVKFAPQFPRDPELLAEMRAVVEQLKLEDDQRVFRNELVRLESELLRLMNEQLRLASEQLRLT